jgi:hypothetical protein
MVTPMDRSFDYIWYEKCENCGNVGAYDIYGDHYCGECLELFQEQADAGMNNGPDGYSYDD